MARKMNLLTFMAGLGKPDMLMTLSAADLEWIDVARHMSRLKEWLRLQLDDRSRLAREHLRDISHIADAHFERRFILFRKTSCTPSWASASLTDS